MIHSGIRRLERSAGSCAGVSGRGGRGTGRYTRGIKISDREMQDFEACHLRRHDFHGDWNYTIVANNNDEDDTPG